MKILIVEFVIILALILAAFLRGRKTGRSLLCSAALAVSGVLRRLAAVVAAFFTVIDEMEFWERVSAQVRLELAQDSFEVESSKVREFRFRG